jgi:membrane protein DedA with SNARE-associated domain
LEEIAHLIQKYGYLFYGITFFWAFLEGETFVIFAGALAVPGLGGSTAPPPIDIYILIAAAWLGSFAGDQLYFFLGRRFGRRILHRFPRIQGGVQLAIDMLHKYHTVFILTYRYMYGVRNFASLGMGMSELSWPRFASLNFVAAFLWANSFAWGGYALGYFAASALGKINFVYIMIGVLVFVFGLFAFIQAGGGQDRRDAPARSRRRHRAPQTLIAAAGRCPTARTPTLFTAGAWWARASPCSRSRSARPTRFPLSSIRSRANFRARAATWRSCSRCAASCSSWSAPAPGRWRTASARGPS